MTFKERYQYNSKTDLIGKGGFARVYKAKDVLLDRYVAIKIFNATGEGQYTVLEEIKKAIRLQHPNLLRYYDVAVVENTNALDETEILQIGVMELANAGDLKQFVKNNPGSPLLFTLLQQVLSGLEYLHQKGIIHRDLKPQNILLVEEDGVLSAKISDFGISKSLDSSASSSMAIGTIEYMAPEQFNPARYGINGKIGTNVDLWSFGIMVHELLTNESLFGQRDANTTAEQIMSSILSAHVPDNVEKLPEPYRGIVKKCLVKNAHNRVRRANELVTSFQNSAAPVEEQTPGYNTHTITLPKEKEPVTHSETEVLPQTILQDSVNSEEEEYEESPPKNNRRKLLIGAVIGAVMAVVLYVWSSYGTGNSSQSSPAAHPTASNDAANIKPGDTDSNTTTPPNDATVLPVTGNVKIYPVLNNATGKWGFSDASGKVVLPYQYDWADSVFDDMARVSINKKIGYIDRTGKLTITAKYPWAARFKDGHAFVSINGGSEQIIDKSGKIIVTVPDESAFHFSDGLLPVLLYEKWGYINGTGKQAIPLKYKFASFFCEGFAAVGLDDKTIVIDKAGNKISSFNFGNAGAPYKGVVPVSLNNKWGLVDMKGNEIVPLKYDRMGNFSDGLALVEIDNKQGFIDITGKEVIACKYYGIITDFSEGLAGINSNNGWGYIDKTGREVMHLNYYSGNRFSNGRAAVRLDDKWGFIDKTGKEVIARKYDYAADFFEGLAKVSINRVSFCIDKTGKIVSAF